MEFKTKPKTAVPMANRRFNNRRTTSQPILKEMTIKYKFSSGNITPRETPPITMPSSRQTKVDCSKLINYDIFNINGVLGNKAIMATTSPSLLTNLKSSTRLKSKSKPKRNPENEFYDNMKEIESIEASHPLHYKPMTQSGLRTERLVQEKLNSRQSTGFGSRLQETHTKIVRLLVLII